MNKPQHPSSRQNAARLAMAAFCLWGSHAQCFAQTAPAAAERAASTPAPTVTPLASDTSKRVIEDDKVRIEETRTRGEVQRITVQSKLPGVKGYDIVPLAARKDPSQEGGAAGSAGLAGKRTWSLLDF